MKRIITIVLSVMLAITASAQTKTLLDKILEPLNETCNYKTIYHLDDPNRICTEQYYSITFDDFNFQDIFLHRSSPHNDSISRKQVLLNSHFCNSLDSLMKIAEEGYHYENHYKGKGDSIIYSICLRNIDGGIKRRINNHGEVVYPDAIESISYDFHSWHYKSDTYHQRDTIVDGVKVPIYKKAEQEIDTILGGAGHLTYAKAELIDEIRPFDKEQYYQIIQPVLKQKGIKSWKFKWEISDDYDYNPKEYTHGYWSISGGGATREGTMFFIPKENKDLGDKTFSAIDSLTFNYISNNYEQDFYYRSNQHNEAKTTFVPNELRHILSAHFNIDNGDRVEVLVGYTEAGYYIVVSENNGSNGFPVEWYALKSFNNGKKEYIKGAKK